MGVVDDLVIVEKETFEVLMQEDHSKGNFVIENAVKLVLSDYSVAEETSLIIAKLCKGE